MKANDFLGRVPFFFALIAFSNVPYNFSKVFFTFSASEFFQSIVPSIVDGIVMGLGFSFALTLLGAAREVLGAGSIFDYKFVSADATTMLLFILPPGAFIALGFLIAFMNRLTKNAS